jgi:hypothetical protein
LQGPRKVRGIVEKGAAEGWNICKAQTSWVDEGDSLIFAVSIFDAYPSDDE